MQNYTSTALDVKIVEKIQQSIISIFKDMKNIYVLHAENVWKRSITCH